MDGYVLAGEVLKACAHPVRLQILEVLLRDGDACVCHLEAQLGQRQAAISQHLARMRQVGLVSDRRDGWNVYYSAAEPSMAPLLAAARTTANGVAHGRKQRILFQQPGHRPGKGCSCPRCSQAVEEPARR